MDMPAERVPEAPAPLTDGFEPQPALAREEMESLHRAINERRAQQENPELLRHLRSL